MLDIAADGRRPAGQPGPDVALHRGPAELGPDLARARHPDPARAVVDVVRRARPPAAGAVPARLRHPRHAAAPAHDAGPRRARPLLVRPDPADHREGVRAVRVGAEPGHHRARTGARSCASGCWARARRRRSRRSCATAPTSSSADTWRSSSRRMNALTEHAAARPGRIRRADRGARPADRQPVRQGRAGAGHPQRAPLPRRPARPGRGAAPHPRPGGRAAHRRQAARPDPQDARRHPDRPRLPGARRRTARRSPGLYAAGEVAGFGGGGVHGYNALEGTFLGGCLFSGRAAGRAAAGA